MKLVILKVASLAWFVGLALTLSNQSPASELSGVCWTDLASRYKIEFSGDLKDVLKSGKRSLGDFSVDCHKIRDAFSRVSQILELLGTPSTSKIYYPRLVLTWKPINWAHGAVWASHFGERLEIWVSLNSPDLEASLVHELFHFYHSQLLGDELFLQATQRPDSSWAVEGTAFLGTLLLLNRESLTDSEKYFLGHYLRGNFFQMGSQLNLFGLNGLWIRYLLNHTNDQIKLLRELARMPEKPNPVSSLNTLIQDQTHMTLPDFYNYFLAALVLNTRLFSENHMFSLGFTQGSERIEYAPTRLSSIPEGGCTTLEPLEFSFYTPLAAEKIDYRKSHSGLRYQLFFENREPVYLTDGEFNSADLGPTHSRSLGFLIYNPLLSPAQVCWLDSKTIQKRSP